jgi:hypothetical protein
MTKAPGEPRFRYQMGRTLVVRHEYNQALENLQVAADHGYAMASNDLGRLYRDGKGVRRDIAQAARLFRQAAAGGVAEADRHLAELLWTGNGVLQDREQALRLFSRAADRGDPWSHQRLAELYERDDGVTKDLSEALFHHALAAKLFARIGGDTDASVETARRGSLARKLVSLNMNDGTVGSVIRGITFVLSLVVAISVAVEGFLRFGERWRHYRQTEEALKIAGWEFSQLSGPYLSSGGHSQAYPSFAEDVETVLKREVEEYVTRVVREKETKNA